MKALVLNEPAGPDHLSQAMAVTHLPTPQCAPGEVLVRVIACGLNPVDWKVARAGHRAWSWPHILGLDIAGVVLEMSDAAARLRPDVGVGDRVALHHDLRAQGGLAQFACVDALALEKIPHDVTFAEAAALPCAALTAYQAVTRLDVQAGDHVLITAGAGAVGGYAIQLARLRGAQVSATASENKIEEARRLGAHTVINYRQAGSPEQVARLARASTPQERGVDAVLDTVSAQSATANLAALAFNGRLAHIGGRPDVSTIEEFTISPTVMEVSLGAAYSSGTARDRRWLGQGLEELLAMVSRRELDARVSDERELSQVPQAYTQLAAGHTQGKIVARLAE